MNKKSLHNFSLQWFLYLFLCICRTCTTQVTGRPSTHRIISMFIRGLSTEFIPFLLHSRNLQISPVSTGFHNSVAHISDQYCLQKRVCEWLFWLSEGALPYVCLSHSERAVQISNPELTQESEHMATSLHQPWTSASCLPWWTVLDFINKCLHFFFTCVKIHFTDVLIWKHPVFSLHSLYCRGKNYVQYLFVYF